jgi:DNA-binding NtrC family response regulator
VASYDGPGNVRYWHIVCASIADHAPGRGRLSAAMLPEHIAGVMPRAARGLEEARVEFERRYVRAALAQAGGRRAAAAERLGITRQGLDKIMKRLGIEGPLARALHTGSAPEFREDPRR